MTTEFICKVDAIAIPASGATLMNARDIKLSCDDIFVNVDRLQGEALKEQVLTCFAELDTTNDVKIRITNDPADIKGFHGVLSCVCSAKLSVLSDPMFQFRSQCATGYTDFNIQTLEGKIPSGMRDVKVGETYLIGYQIQN